MARSYTERTIKILFGLSGNRCAFPMCRTPLIDVRNADPDPVVLGEMCHIIASSSNGPRGASSLPSVGRDSHGNLLLLCPTHHALVDARPERYPPETLRAWKARAEQGETPADDGKEGAYGTSRGTADAALQLRNQLEGLTKRSMLRSERVEDRAGHENDALRLSSALYVERDVERGVAERLAPTAGPGRSLLLVGEPGVGKTSLLWSIVSQALAGNETAWLLDAPSLMKLFDDAASPAFPISLLGELCRQPEFSPSPPLLAIDTADLCLAAGSQSDRFTELLSYLQQVNIRLLIASRPQESEEVRFLNPHIEVLGDYSEKEFVQAVERYAGAYIGDGASERCSQIARQLHDSAAQGFPIREVAMKPLTLRMLFSIYAPDDINHAEVNIVGLYEEFWRRRVEDDVRAGSRGSDPPGRDLSEAARLIGVKMLGEGAPDISLETTRATFRLAKVNSADLDQLVGRGVLELSGTGRDRSVSFFHQTFFEHAAAEAVVRGPDAAFLQGLYQQFRATGGNQFLGCVLERALVLAESRSTALREASQAITLALVQGDEPFLSAGIYAFAHRSGTSPEAALVVREKIAAGHAPTIERLLAVAPNMGRERRRAAVTMLGTALRKGEHRRIEKIFHFFKLAARQFPEEVISAIAASGLMKEFAADALATGLARMNFYDFAPSLVSTNPEWVFSSLTDLAVASLGRFAGERDFERACGAIGLCAEQYPEQAKRFLATVERAARGNARISAGLEEMRALSALVAQVARKPPTAFLDEIQTSSGSRQSQFLDRVSLAAAALTAAPADLDDLAALIGRCAGWSNKQLLHAFGATTLGTLVERWRGLPADQLEKLLSKTCDEISTIEPPARKLVEAGFLQGEHIPVESLTGVIRRLGYDPAEVWQPDGVLFHRVVEAANAGVAEAALSIELETHRQPCPPQIAQKLLLQMRKAPESAAARQFALKLALSTSTPADAVIALLERSETMTPEWVPSLPAIEALAVSRLRLGDPASRTRSAKLMRHLARLTAQTPLQWSELLERGLRDRNEAARTAFFGAVRYLMVAEPAQWEPRLDQLLAVQPDGETARAQAFGAVATVLKMNPSLCERYFDKFFDAVFRAPPSAEAVFWLAQPMYLLHEQGWTRIPDFCERLIDGSAAMSSKTCQRIYRVYAKLYLSVGASAGREWCLRLLRRVPTLHPEVARLVLPLGLNLADDEFRQLIDLYATSEGIPGGTLAKIADLRLTRERRTGVSVSGKMVDAYVERIALHAGGSGGRERRDA